MELLKTMSRLEEMETTRKILSLFNSANNSLPASVFFNFVDNISLQSTLDGHGKLVEVETGFERVTDEKDHNNEDKNLGHSDVTTLKHCIVDCIEKLSFIKGNECYED